MFHFSPSSLLTIIQQYRKTIKVAIDNPKQINKIVPIIINSLMILIIQPIAP